MNLLWLVILSNVMHGFAYAFFFATVYIYVDENFPTDVRTSAQSLFNLLILGLGPLLSNFLSARLGVIFKGADGNDQLSSALPRTPGIGAAGDGDPGDLLSSQGERPGSRRGSRPCHISRGHGSYRRLAW